MAGWRVELAPAAARQLRSLPPAQMAALRGVILGLGEERQPPGSRKLRGHRDLWRVRVRVDGRAWRIVYQLRRDRELVVVVRVVPRDEGTYRGV